MNNKGISVISLVIAIIIIVLITSITLYTGIPIISNSNKTMAEYRLRAISNAIIAYERELNYNDSVGTADNPRLISVADYYTMGLSDYADVENVPPTYIYKEIDGDFKTYNLITYSTVKVNYESGDEIRFSFKYQDDIIDSNFKVEFDESKGVNRPLICDDMQPVILTFDDDYYKVQSVKDIYDEDWYDYNSSSPMWANVMIKSRGEGLHDKYLYYVWIPRFAYKISYFDANTDYNNIPASSISIIFLRGNTDYMKNNEVIPSGYQVHPAFKYYEKGDTSSEPIDISGFWVNKELVGGGAEALFKSASEHDPSNTFYAYELSKLENIHPDANSEDIESRLISNTQWSAIAYLSHATVGNVADGSSLGEWNASGIFNLDSLQYVAAVCVGTDSHGNPVSMPSYIPYGDKYYYKTVHTQSGDVLELTYVSDEKETLKYGDGMLATSVGNSVNSAWFGGTSVKPTTSIPYIMRGYDRNLFSYNAISRKPFGGGAFKNVLIIKDR
ncbi:MAG: hypothetical protein IKR04_06365 [Clostridia bacterium]|nr:hypothetical protein [Clostridia bacterium]